MVDDDRYCIDVLTQISAIRAALDKVALGLLDGHTHHCLAGGHGGPHQLIGHSGQPAGVGTHDTIDPMASQSSFGCRPESASTRR